MNNLAINMFKGLVLICAIIDAFKYFWQAGRMKENKSSADVSRKFLFTSILTHTVITIYTVITRDKMMIFIWGFGLLTVIYCFYYCYRYYPRYKKSKKDNLWIFILDSYGILSEKLSRKYGYYRKPRSKIKLDRLFKKQKRPTFKIKKYGNIYEETISNK